VPDLDLTPRKISTPRHPAQPNAGRTPAKATPSPSLDVGLGDDHGMALERSNVTGMPGMPGSPAGRGHGQVAASIGETDEFSMDFERTGPFMAPTPPGRPIAGGSPSPPASAHPNTSARPASSGLEVAYKRSDLEDQPSDRSGPSLARSAGAYAVTAIGFAAGFESLAKLVHRHGGRSFISLFPHAFDASSSIQSGAFALSALAAAIAVGAIGVKLRPRSHAMIVSGGMLLLASLAMVTVTLVSLDEHPTPADGALLIPYVMPPAFAFLGFGVAGRGAPLFLRGGVRRGSALLAGFAGGALVLIAVEISRLSGLLLS
jgi:hypothetical protein